MARTGQAEAQAGATQCMHCFLAKRWTPGAFSVRFTTVKAVSLVSRRVASASSPGGGGFPFASAQAASQARQPTHRVVSTRTPGESVAPPGASTDACAVPAAATPAPIAATSRKPLLVIFMCDSLPGGDEVQGSDHADSDQREHEGEHHGVAPFGVAGW